MSPGPRALVYSGNADRDRELPREEAEAEREPLVEMEATEIKHRYGMETETVGKSWTSWLLIVEAVVMGKSWASWLLIVETVVMGKSWTSWLLIVETVVMGESWTSWLLIVETVVVRLPRTRRQVRIRLTALGLIWMAA